MTQRILDGLAELGFWQDFWLNLFQPCEISLQLVFFKLQALCFSFVSRELCKPFVERKKFVDPLDGLLASAAQNIFFSKSWRDGIYKVPPGMRPAESILPAGYFLVASVAICFEDAMEILLKNLFPLYRKKAREASNDAG